MKSWYIPLAALVLAPSLVIASHGAVAGSLQSISKTANALAQHDASVAKGQNSNIILVRRGRGRRGGFKGSFGRRSRGGMSSRDFKFRSGGHRSRSRGHISRPSWRGNRVKRRRSSRRSKSFNKNFSRRHFKSKKFRRKVRRRRFKNRFLFVVDPFYYYNDYGYYYRRCYHPYKRHYYSARYCKYPSYEISYRRSYRGY